MNIRSTVQHVASFALAMLVASLVTVLLSYVFRTPESFGEFGGLLTVTAGLFALFLNQTVKGLFDLANLPSDFSSEYMARLNRQIDRDRDRIERRFKQGVIWICVSTVATGMLKNDLYKSQRVLEIGVDALMEVKGWHLAAFVLVLSILRLGRFLLYLMWVSKEIESKRRTLLLESRRLQDSERRRRAADEFQRTTQS